MNNVFSLETDGFISYIYGSKFQFRASERSAKKFKLKGTIDLWFHSKSKGNLLRCLLFSCSFKNRVSGRLKIEWTSWNFSEVFLHTEEWLVSLVFRAVCQTAGVLVASFCYLCVMFCLLLNLWLVLITWPVSILTVYLLNEYFIL